MSSSPSAVTLMAMTLKATALMLKLMLKLMLMMSQVQVCPETDRRELLL
jgi:hypothetical protein